jgi:hypothetical protein
VIAELLASEWWTKSEEEVLLYYKEFGEKRNEK